MSTASLLCIGINKNECFIYIHWFFLANKCVISMFYIIIHCVFKHSSVKVDFFCQLEPKYKIPFSESQTYIPTATSLTIQWFTMISPLLEAVFFFWTADKDALRPTFTCLWSWLWEVKWWPEILLTCRGLVYWLWTASWVEISSLIGLDSHLSYVREFGDRRVINERLMNKI